MMASCPFATIGKRNAHASLRWRARLRSCGPSGRALSDREHEAEQEEGGDRLLEEATAERVAELAEARALEEAHRTRRRTHGKSERWAVAWNLRRSLHTGLCIAVGIGLLMLVAFGAVLLRPRRSWVASGWRCRRS
jgi:hypothetical protein